MSVVKYLIVFLLFGAQSLAAQVMVPRYGVSAGTRVRVTAPDITYKPFVGRVSMMNSDTLYLAQQSAQIRIPVAAIKGFEISEGRARWKWAVAGGLIGMVGGGAIGVLAMDRNDGIAQFIGMVGGALLGAPTGAVVGAIAAPERWYQYRIR